MIKYLKTILIVCPIILTILLGINIYKYYSYQKDNNSIIEKIETVVSEIYHGDGVVFSDEAMSKIEKFEELGYGNYPVCIAKTQYSLSDNPKLLGYPKGYMVNVRDVNIYTGAKFIVVYLGNIMTMPGLSRVPNYMNIDIDSNYMIKGLF